MGMFWLAEQLTASPHDRLHSVELLGLQLGLQVAGKLVNKGMEINWS
jgi:hypothetical protein